MGTTNHQVFLDGKPVKNCLDFDLKRGMVKYYEVDRDGRIVMEGPAVKIFTGRGRVEVKSFADLIKEGKYY